MKNIRPTRSSTPASFFESLESRTLLSSTLAFPAAASGSLDQPAITASLHKAQTTGTVPTTTTLTFQSSTIGQPITFTVTVRGPKVAFPTGTVLLRDHNVVFHTFVIPTVTDTANPPAGMHKGFYTASFTIPAGAGDKTYSFGQHRIVAQYSGDSTFHFSHDHSPLIIKKPHFTTLPDKVKIATITPGTGPGIVSGQTANVFYTGWNYRTGIGFDNSFAHGATSLPFKIDASPLAVIPGFNEGVKGMKVGETRVVVIPSSLAYGAQGSPPKIPGNSKLVFLLTLQSIT